MQCNIASCNVVLPWEEDAYSVISLFCIVPFHSIPDQSLFHSSDWRHPAREAILAVDADTHFYSFLIENQPRTPHPERNFIMLNVIYKNFWGFLIEKQPKIWHPERSSIKLDVHNSYKLLKKGWVASFWHDIFARKRRSSGSGCWLMLLWFLDLKAAILVHIL